MIHIHFYLEQNIFNPKMRKYGSSEWPLLIEITHFKEIFHVGSFIFEIHRSNNN